MLSVLSDHFNDKFTSSETGLDKVWGEKKKEKAEMC